MNAAERLSGLDLEELRRSVARDRYRNDPVRFVTERLGEFVWSRQREILESIRDNRRTSVPSCHEAGKSWLAARAVAWWIESHEPGTARVLTSATTTSQVKAALWHEINRAHARGGLVGRTNQTEWWVRMPEGNEELVALGRKPSDMEPDAFQGLHAPYVLVIFDEASGIARALWDAADSLVANEWSRFLAIGNPTDADSKFAEVSSPGSGWNTIRIDAFDTPNFTDETVPEYLRPVLISRTWVEEKKRDWGESNPVYQAKVRGRFPEVSSDGLIPPSWVEAARDRELEPSEPIEIGMDVGAGGNRSVIALRRGPVARIVRKDTEPDTMRSCGNLLRDLRESRASRAKVDFYGVGQGVVDRAREQGASVEGVRVGDRARDPEQYTNLRAEGFWELRKRFERGEIDLDPDDDDLAAQLVAIRYRATSAGKIQIERKEEMERRGMASPDEADALMLAFLDPPGEPEKPRATWGKRARERRSRGAR